MAGKEGGSSPQSISSRGDPSIAGVGSVPTEVLEDTHMHRTFPRKHRHGVPFSQEEQFVPGPISPYSRPGLSGGGHPLPLAFSSQQSWDKEKERERRSGLQERETDRQRWEGQGSRKQVRADNSQLLGC